MRISENGCPFCVKKVTISELVFAKPPLLAFYTFRGFGEVHASIQFWGVVCGGGEGVWHLN